MEQCECHPHTIDGPEPALARRSSRPLAPATLWVRQCLPAWQSLLWQTKSQTTYLMVSGPVWRFQPPPMSQQVRSNHCCLSWSCCRTTAKQDPSLSPISPTKEDATRTSGVYASNRLEYLTATAVFATPQRRLFPRGQDGALTSTNCFRTSNYSALLYAHSLQSLLPPPRFFRSERTLFDNFAKAAENREILYAVAEGTQLPCTGNCNARNRRPAHRCE